MALPSSVFFTAWSYPRRMESPTSRMFFKRMPPFLFEKSIAEAPGACKQKAQEEKKTVAKATVFWWERVDSLFCGNASAVAKLPRSLAKSRLSNPPQTERPNTLSDDRSFWWERVDSNHRSKMQQIYSLSPLATRESIHIEKKPMIGLEPITC